MILNNSISKFHRENKMNMYLGVSVCHNCKVPRRDSLVRLIIFSTNYLVPNGINTFL